MPHPEKVGATFAALAAPEAVLSANEAIAGVLDLDLAPAVSTGHVPNLVTADLHAV